MFYCSFFCDIKQQCIFNLKTSECITDPLSLCCRMRLLWALLALWRSCPQWIVLGTLPARCVHVPVALAAYGVMKIKLVLCSCKLHTSTYSHKDIWGAWFCLSYEKRWNSWHAGHVCSLSSHSYIYVSGLMKCLKQKI